MLANFFGKSKPINFVVIAILFFCYYILALFVSFTSHQINLTTLKNLGVLLFYFFFYNFIVQKNNLTKNNTFGFLFLVLLFGLFPESFLTLKTIFLCFLVLLMIRKIYSLQSQKNIYQKLFDAVFWLSIAFIIEPFSVIFIILIYAAIYLYTNFNVRTLLIPLVGFATVIGIYFTYCFATNQTVLFNRLFNWNTSFDFSTYNSNKHLLSLIFVGIFLTVAIFSKVSKSFLPFKSIYRKHWMLTLLIFITSILFIILVDKKDKTELIFLFFPISILITNWLESVRNKSVKNYVLGIFFITSALRLFF